MKKLTLTTFLSILALLAVAIVPASADPITFTYSGDNSVIGGWYLTDGGSPTPIPSLPAATSWQTASTFTLNLTPDPLHSYQIIWQVVNDDPSLNRNPSEFNPGGFLAQIATPSPLFKGDWLSSSAWEVAFVPNLNQPGDLSSLSLSWVTATQYGANDNSGTIWNQVNGGPIAGISGSAQWIWTAANFANEGAPGFMDSVFIKTTMTDPPSSVPEPSTLLLISSGLISLVGLKKKFRK